MTCYVTTPIYYVNDRPHIGHVYTTLAADIMARFARLNDEDVFFLTGTDEHGQKVAQKAQAHGMTPQQYTDDIAQTFQQMMQDLNVTHNDFIRTTEHRHHAAVQKLWNILHEAGHIYEGTYAGWYATQDEAFYPEKELVDGRAPTGATVTWMEEPCYFFRLSSFQNKLLEYYHAHPDFIAPASRRQEVMRFVEGGLHDLAISRRTCSWGISVPNDASHVIYVWMDALTNYITALGYPHQSDLYTTFWPHAVHLVGKDILRFHAVYWPAFLLAANLPLPKRIYAHGWWTNEGQKMSKSLGNAIDYRHLIQTYGLDALRYFLFREVPFGQDGDFSEKSMVNRLNYDLADAWGNLAQRVLMFIHRFCQNVEMLDVGEEIDEQDAQIANWGTEKTLDFLHHAMSEQRFHLYLDEAWRGIMLGNQYMEAHAPWRLNKQGENGQKRMLIVLAHLCTLLRRVGIILQPFMPQASAQLLDQLGIDQNSRQLRHCLKHTSHSPFLPIPTPLFAKHL